MSGLLVGNSDFFSLNIRQICSSLLPGIASLVSNVAYQPLVYAGLNCTEQSILLSYRHFVVYNSLGHNRREIITLTVDRPNVKVTKYSALVVLPHQISPIWQTSTFAVNCYEVCCSIYNFLYFPAQSQIFSSFFF